MSAKQIGGGIVIFDTNTAGAGGGQHTANGVSGDGSIATPIVLGGSLDQDTTIDVTGFVLDMLTSDGTGNTSDVGVSDNGAELDAGSDQLDNVAIAAGNRPGIGAYWGITWTNLANRHQGIYSKLSPLNSLDTGILVQDNIDNIGLIGAALFAVSSPNQYAQYGNLNSIVGTVNTPVETALNSTFLLYTVNTTKNQLLRIDPAIFLDSLGITTNVSFQLQYTDQAGTSRTITLAMLTSLTTPTIPSQTIYAEKNTAVNLIVTLNIAGAQYQVYASCSYVGVQN